LIAAPGAELVLISPRATLAPAIAGREERHRIARRINFRNRYCYAPDMTESASKVWHIHDPLHRPDAMHAALCGRPWVVPLRAPFTGEGTEDMLREMRVLDPILEAVMEEKLSPAYFTRLWCGRRSNGSYLYDPLCRAAFGPPSARDHDMPVSHRPAERAALCPQAGRTDMRGAVIPRSDPPV